MSKKKQQECIKLMITKNLTQKEIAKEIGVNESTICRWKKISEFQEALEKNTREHISFIAPKAIQTVAKLLNHKNAYIRFQAAKDILDRAGYKPKDKVEHSGAIEFDFTDR